MVESEIAGNFPNQNNHHFATVAEGGSPKHHGQASHSTHHDMHEDNGHEQTEKGDNADNEN